MSESIWNSCSTFSYCLAGKIKLKDGSEDVVSMFTGRLYIFEESCVTTIETLELFITVISVW